VTAATSTTVAAARGAIIAAAKHQHTASFQGGRANHHLRRAHPAAIRAPSIHHRRPHEAVCDPVQRPGFVGDVSPRRLRIQGPTGVPKTVATISNGA